MRHKAFIDLNPCEHQLPTRLAWWRAHMHTLLANKTAKFHLAQSGRLSACHAMAAKATSNPHNRGSHLNTNAISQHRSGGYNTLFRTNTSCWPRHGKEGLFVEQTDTLLGLDVFTPHYYWHFLLKMPVVILKGKTYGPKYCNRVALRHALANVTCCLVPNL